MYCKLLPFEKLIDWKILFYKKDAKMPEAFKQIINTLDFEWIKTVRCKTYDCLLQKKARMMVIKVCMLL